MNISIIGGGNLGINIAKGLAQTQAYHLTIARRKVALLQPLTELGIQITNDNLQAIQAANIIILSVKPKQAEQVLRELAPSLQPEKQVLVSVVTGLTIKDIHAYIGKTMPIFRAMPNTATVVCESMTCISPQYNTVEQKEQVNALFQHLGQTVFIDEYLMEAATVLGACGIAYALRFIRAAMQGGIEIGFDAKTALRIATQTVRGAATLLLDELQHPESEIDKVTTPQGCTIAGLNEMEHQGFSSSLIKGIMTSYKKIETIK